MTIPARHLIHTCSIQRNTPIPSLSGEPTPGWTTITTGVRCRYIQKGERLAAETRSSQMVRTDVLLLPPDTDVTESDRVVNISLYNGGTLVDAGPFGIEALLTRNTRAAHHLSAALERIT